MFSLQHYRILALSLTVAASQQALAMGIDKLSLNIDASADFSAVTRVIVFNDSDETAYVTGRPVSWSNDETGKMLTSPTTDLTISPPMLKIPGNGSATFTVRYTGAPKQEEAAYRVVFKETRVPAFIPEDNAAGAPPVQINTGFVMTIPAFVSNFSEKAPAFNGVTATFRRTGESMNVTVKNSGALHVVVESINLGGEVAKGLHSTVFARKTITYDGVKAPGPTQNVELKLTLGDATKSLTVTEEK